jgi:hypothetical protein
MRDERRDWRDWMSDIMLDDGRAHITQQLMSCVSRSSPPVPLSVDLLCRARCLMRAWSGVTGFEFLSTNASICFA